MFAAQRNLPTGQMLDEFWDLSAYLSDNYGCDYDELVERFTDGSLI